jgi:hypothetical protein
MADASWLTAEDRAALHRIQALGRPSAAVYAYAIAQTLSVDLSWASSALEGNSYSYLDVQVLLEYGQAAADKSATDALMVLGHRDAVQYLIDNIERIDVSPQILNRLHESLSRGPATGDFAGIATKAQAIADSFGQSIFLLATMPDRRLGRLACNIPLLRHSFAPLSFLEMDRTRYIEAMQAAALGEIEVIRRLYVECYLATAPRYQVQTARNPADIELETRRRADIEGYLRSYIAASLGAGRRLDAADYARYQLSGDPEAQALADRIADIAVALTDANCLAYGISRQQAAEFLALPPIH